MSKAGRRKCEEDESEEDESTEELGYVPGTFLKKYEGLAELQNSAELENRCGILLEYCYHCQYTTSILPLHY